ncbi:MAG: HAMP domain-containing protein [Cytophagales bacterium]|nr:MAG: HAMP domain-containing protein [Cytophagales bacterium]
MNISLKFTLFCLALVLFSCLALLYLANYQTQSSLREEIKVKLERESNFALENIDRFIYERLNDIATFAKDGVISKGTYGKSSATANEINQRLTLFSKSNPLYLNLSYFDTSRIRITDTDTTAYILIGQRHSYTKYWTRVAKEAVVLDISFSEESKQAPVIHFASKVHNQKGEYVGVIVSQILVSNLNQLFKSIIEDETQKNRKLGVALLDSTGNILYSNELKNNKLQEKYPEIDVLNSYIKKQTKQHRWLPNYFESKGKVFFYIKDNGYEAYRGQQWILIMSLPKEVAYKDAEDLRTRLMLTSIPILLVAMFLALFFGQYFSYPIITLTEAVEELEKGNLNVNLTVQKEFGGNRKDEIGILWSHFASMASKLKFKMLEQEDLNHELVNINDQLKVKFDEVQLKNEEIQSQHEKMSQQKRHLESAVKEIEKKNKNITASINYAERIQSAILPDRDYIKSLFPESFVLFKPRDIVSGDFYWFRKMVSPEGDELIAVAAVDCTGHGVPGALMSVIGDTLMYQVIVVERTFEPAQVLRKLNNGVKKILKQEDVHHHHNKHDGMDMALCVINKTKMTLQYVGAHRPLWYFQKNVFHEIEGDRITVGGISRRKQELNMHNINIHKGDTFYIFSDGYTDQFGGYRDMPARKYSPSRLRKLLADVQPHDMPTQGFILDNEFELWKGSESQLDDVMVIGIRF